MNRRRIISKVKSPTSMELDEGIECYSNSFENDEAGKPSTLKRVADEVSDHAYLT